MRKPHHFDCCLSIMQTILPIKQVIRYCNDLKSHATTNLASAETNKCYEDVMNLVSIFKWTLLSQDKYYEDVMNLVSISN